MPWLQQDLTTTLPLVPSYICTVLLIYLLGLGLMPWLQQDLTTTLLVTLPLPLTVPSYICTVLLTYLLGLGLMLWLQEDLASDSPLSEIKIR